MDVQGRFARGFMSGADTSMRSLDMHKTCASTDTPDDEPSQPYIAGVTNRAKTAAAEARQWLVAVCWQTTLAGHAF